MANKNIKLRAFKITNNASLSQDASALKQELFDALERTDSSKERCLILNQEDNAKEQDLISNYFMNGIEQSLFCTLLRMAPGDNVQHITENLLAQKTFNIESLASAQLKTKAIYKRHFDFSIKGNYLVTNLPGNITITHLQTYLGYFLKNERIELTPVIKAPEHINLSDLKTATFGSGFNVTPTTNQTTSSDVGFKSIRNVATNIIRGLLNENADLDDIMLDEIISAELLIKFKRPKTMSEDDYKEQLGAVLKPISDLDDITFTTQKSGKVITGRDVLYVKEVSIETTSSGHIVQQQLVQEMAKFLDELIMQ